MQDWSKCLTVCKFKEQLTTVTTPFFLSSWFPGFSMLTSWSNADPVFFFFFVAISIFWSSAEQSLNVFFDVLVQHTLCLCVDIQTLNLLKEGWSASEAKVSQVYHDISLISCVSNNQNVMHTLQCPCQQQITMIHHRKKGEALVIMLGLHELSSCFSADFLTERLPKCSWFVALSCIVCWIDAVNLWQRSACCQFAKYTKYIRKYKLGEVLVT